MDTHVVVRRGLDSSAVRGAALIVLGILAIAFPVAASITVSLVVAWVLIVAGVTHLVFAWRTMHNESRLWTAFVGLFYVLAGIAILGNPLWGVASLALVLSFLLMVEGMAGVFMYFTVEGTSKWVLVSGCLTVVLAAIITSGWLSHSFWLIGTLVGINLMIRGACSLAASIEGERLNQLHASP